MPVPRLFTAVALLAASPALAGGFYLQEQSPLAVGRAFAGEAAAADSAATVFYNPAGMTRLPGVTVELGSHVLFVDSSQQDRGSTRTGPGGAGSFATGGGDGGNPFSQPLLVPSGYVSAQVADSRVWLGLGFSAPFGVVVDYGDDWFGRYDSIRSELRSINIQPTIAFKLDEKLSIGGGIDIQTLKADLTSALPNVSPLLPDGRLRISGDDLSIGWNAGIMGDLGPVRLGAHYRSKVDHDLSGKLELSGLLGPLAGNNGQRKGIAPVSLPEIASIGAVVGSGKLRVLVGGNWYNWSRFDRIVVLDRGTTLLESPQNYRDTYSGSVGVEYDVSPKLTLRAGSMYDQTPTHDAFRTSRVPDGNRTWATGGATLTLSPTISTNVSYAHVFVKTSQVDRTDPVFEGTPAFTNTTIRSTSRGAVDIIASSISLRF